MARQRAVHKIRQNLGGMVMKSLSGPNGHLISKRLFGVFNFLQKMNENKTANQQDNLRFHSNKLEFVRLFFGGNLGLKKSF